VLQKAVGESIATLIVAFCDYNAGKERVFICKKHPIMYPYEQIDYLLTTAKYQ